MASNTSITLTLHRVRTSYFYGFDPYVNTDKEGKVSRSFCSHFLLPLNHPDLPAVRKAIVDVAVAQWKEKAKEMLVAFKGQDKICLHEGNISKAGEEAYKDILYLSGSNGKNRFTIVETRDGKNVPLVAADGRPYSGSYVNAIVAIWAQQNDWGKRINCQIQGVQHVGHGEAFGGGRVATADEFGLNATDADAAMPGGEQSADEDLSSLLG